MRDQGAKDLERAYQVLSDPEQRLVYDQFGEEGLLMPDSARSATEELQGPQVKHIYQELLVSLEDLYHRR